MSTDLRDRYLRSRHMVQKAIHEYSEKPALRAYMEIFLTLVTISSFGLFAIRPTAITIGKLIQEIKAKEQTLNTMNDKIENLRVAKDLYTRENEKIKLVKEAIPNHPTPDNLALQVDGLAKANGVILNNFSIEDTKLLGDPPSEDDGNLTLAIYVSGSYQDIINFVSALENLRRPIRFDGLTISSINSKEGGKLYMSLNNLSTPYIVKK